jgi:hypothetical protein
MVFMAGSPCRNGDGPFCGQAGDASITCQVITALPRRCGTRCRSRRASGAQARRGGGKCWLRGSDRKCCSIWSAVGSSNFDDRSVETNEEIMLGIKDEAIAQRFDAIFEKYAAGATEVDFDQWTRRSLWHQLKDHAFYTINELL